MFQTGTMLLRLTTSAREPKLPTDFLRCKVLDGISRRGLAMLQILAIGALCATLAGCMATGQDRAIAAAAADDSSCQSYGAQPGSQAYFQCRMAKDQQRQANDAAIRAAVIPYLLH
jgi:hypothetical protein